uniref:tigger transposable element derived 5-like n=1 Tax=Myxine glutinosa TaxID=7769 RepID=UPI00358DE128
MDSKDKKRTMKSWSIEEKLAAVDRVKAGKSLTWVARDMGASPASVCDWKKKEVKLRKGFVTLKGHRKRVRLGRYEQMEEALLLWFQQIRMENVPISGPMLQDKALQIYNSLPGSSGENEAVRFRASSGWLTRFKIRYGLHLSSVHGESASTSLGPARPFTKDCAWIMPDQVHSANESGLFCKKMPNKTAQEETSAPSKGHLSPLYTNAVGTYRLKSAVEKPKPFENINMSQLDNNELDAKKLIDLALKPKEPEQEDSAESNTVSVTRFKKILSLFSQLQDIIADYDLCSERRDNALKELRSLERQYYQALWEKKNQTKMSDFFKVLHAPLPRHPPAQLPPPNVPSSPHSPCL